MQASDKLNSKEPIDINKLVNDLHEQTSREEITMKPTAIVKKEIKGVVAELGGKYWGVQYEDGNSTSYDFGPIENAKISDPKFCTSPTDLTYTNSPYITKLKLAKLVPVTKTITWEV